MSFKDTPHIHCTILIYVRISLTICSSFMAHFSHMSKIHTSKLLSVLPDAVFIIIITTYLSFGFHSQFGIYRPVSHPDVGIRLPLQLLFVLLPLHLLLCLLIFVLDLKSLQISHQIRSPFFSFALFSCSLFLSASVVVYIISFPIAHTVL